MKPKEKAKELVNKFMFTSFNIQENTDDFKFKLLIQAKQCAFIAVDEIIKTLKDNDLYIGGETNIDEIIRFWQEVKQEIENV